MILCSYVNFRSSYQRMDGVSYLVGAGEWIYKTSELSDWFRTRFQHQAISILEHLQKQNYISYTKVGHGNLIKFMIRGVGKSITQPSTTIALASKMAVSSFSGICCT